MTTTFSDLPLDILLLITSHLDVPTFLSLTSTCSSLSTPSLSHHSAFWLTAVRSTFRVPNQPVVSHDGLRWKKLYKRLLTQTRPYTWGSNSKGQLGHSYLSADEIHAIPPAERMRRARRSRQVSWPETMDAEGGIIADLQAGGWSTSYLTSKGCLYTAGVIDGMRISGSPPRPQIGRARPERLRYPEGWTDPADRYETETAVRQFSAGRAHVLGLSDAGRIWSWWDVGETGVMVKLLNVDLNERGNANGRSLVKKVVAGWNKSAALIKGKGIVIWEPAERGARGYEHEDTILVLQTATVPNTGFERGQAGRARRVDGSSPDEEVGEVSDFIVLEHCVIFNTHHGRVFASWIDDGRPRALPLFELFPHVNEEGSTPHKDGEGRLRDSEFVTDVQGTFRNFALFMKNGEVLNGTQDTIHDWIQEPRTRTRTHLIRVPALQNTGVIKLAFGDHHFLALHKDGFITSYGTESQACGSLGLGGNRDPEGRLRGIRYAGLAGDGKLVPHAYTTGRRVWFEPEKRQWIKFLASGGTDPQEAVERIRLCSAPLVQAEVSEWIEKEGNAWEEKFAHPPQEAKFSGASTTSFRTAQETTDDNLSPYFALSVTAAGWHSGALVLVNESAAAQIRENCIVHEPLPFSDPPPQPQSTPTQDHPQQGIIPTLLTNIAWFLGLTTPPENPNPNPDPPPPIFANPRIRFPPHRLDPSRQMPPEPAQPAQQPPGPEAQEENVWDPNDDPANPRQGGPPPPQPGAAPVPGPTHRPPGPITGHGPAQRIARSREEAQERIRAQEEVDRGRYQGQSPANQGQDQNQNQNQNQQPPNQGQGQPQGERPRRAFTDPVNHGAAPDKDSRWVWAYDSFPRLRLSDGREMPGEIEFAEWRGGRPEWELGFTGYSG